MDMAGSQGACGEEDMELLRHACDLDDPHDLQSSNLSTHVHVFNGKHPEYCKGEPHVCMFNESSIADADIDDVGESLIVDADVDMCTDAHAVGSWGS